MFGVTFPGLQITKLDMVHNTGTKPSVCYCTVIPNEPEYPDLAQDGTLCFTYEGEELFSFKHCAIRNFYSRAETSINALQAEVEIVDRRHRWSQQTVGGHYNVRTSSGTLDSDTQKTWEELFDLVFQAIGEDEGNYLLNLPDDDLPAPMVEWDNIPCDQALEMLAEKAQCEICLSNDDQIVVEARGEGPEIDIDGAKTPELNVSLVEIQPAIEVEFAPTRYEWWWNCKAAAINTTGRIVPLEEADWLADYETFMQYSVPGGYTEALPGSKPHGLKTDGLSLATFAKQKYLLFRMFQIYSLYDTSSLPDGGPITSLNDVLPLFPYNLYEVAVLDENGTNPYWCEVPNSDNASDRIFDRTAPFVLAASNVSDVPGKPDTDTLAAYWEEHDRPRINLQRGTILFDRYMIQSDSNGRFDAANVYLKATFRVQDPDTGAYWRYRYSESDDPAATRVVRYGDVGLYHVQIPGYDVMTYSNKQILDNEIGASLVSRYTTSSVRTNWMEWPGLKNISTRGNRPQVRWVMSPLHIMTQSGVNLRHPVLAPTPGGT